MYVVFTTDIDECSTEADSCEQQCVNIEGSYLCDCGEGFALNSDGRIPECLVVKNTLLEISEVTLLVGLYTTL